MNKPAIELKKEIRNNFNNIFDKSKPLKERKNERFKLQNAIEQELMNTNIKTLQNIYILLKVNEFKKKRHQKYYKNGLCEE